MLKIVQSAYLRDQQETVSTCNIDAGNIILKEKPAIIVKSGTDSKVDDEVIAQYMKLCKRALIVNKPLIVRDITGLKVLINLY